MGVRFTVGAEICCKLLSMNGLRRRIRNAFEKRRGGSAGATRTKVFVNERLSDRIEW